MRREEEGEMGEVAAECRGRGEEEARRDRGLYQQGRANGGKQKDAQRMTFWKF